MRTTTSFQSTVEELAEAAIDRDGIAQGWFDGVLLMLIADTFEVEAAANDYLLPNTYRLRRSDGREAALVRVVAEVSR